MGFKYNDQLIIRDRQQMEDLFKYRLQQFERGIVKKLLISNNIGFRLYVVGGIDNGELRLRLTNEPTKDPICIALNHADRGAINLKNTVKFED